MSQNRRTGSPEKTKQPILHRETSPTSEQAIRDGLHPVLHLQRTIGNHAVGRLIRGRQNSRDGVRTTQRGAALQRWFWFGWPGAAAAPKTLYQTSEELWTSLLAFSNRATPELVRVGKNIREYLDKYDLAYASFTSKLEEGEKEAADREKWADVMMAIVIGTGVGLAAGELYVAATIVKKIAYEAAAETAKEVIIHATGSSSAVDFKAPPELNNDKVARGYLDKLVQAWEAVGVVQGAALTFSPRRDALRDAERAKDTTERDKTKPSTTPVRSAPKADPDLQKTLERLASALAVADAALTTFVTTCDIPSLWRGQDTIEQDLWISWMAKGTANAGETLDARGAIGKRAEKLKLVGRVMPEGEYFNAESLAKRAGEEKARLAQIGKVGVVVIPPRFDHNSGRDMLGIMHVRPDAYAAVGRKDPASGGASGTADSYQKIVVWDERAYLRPGEVVMVITTKATGLRVERHGGKTLDVSSGERRTALGLLGITEPEYRPEAGEALSAVVFYAVDELKDVKPPLQVVKSEDGVLVSEADGTKLVLIAPRTSDPFAGAQERQRRLGVPKVIVIELRADRDFEEVRRAGIVITAHGSAHFIAEEIRDARRAAGREPAAAVK